MTYASGSLESVNLLKPRRVCANSFPDPFVWRANDRWYAIATGKTGSDRVFPMMVSEDFETWAEIPGAMDLPPGLGDDFWAPEVAYIDDAWTLFYSVGKSDQGHQLRVARSLRPEGPYVDLGKPILDPETCGFAIDAHPYQDHQGQWWLFYARDILEGTRPGTSIVVAQIEPDLTLKREFTVVARANADWQIYERSRPIYDRVLDWHTLEGPTVVEHNGLLHLFYSGGNWTNDTYGVDWCTSDSIVGPWRCDVVPSPRLLRSEGPLIGPGHNCFVEGPNGHLWAVFHAWNQERTQREMWLAPVQWCPVLDEFADKSPETVVSDPHVGDASHSVL